jgi:hemolysin III
VRTLARTCLKFGSISKSFPNDGGIHISNPKKADKFSKGEEIANAITHGLGSLGSVLGLVVLTTLASSRGDAKLVIGVSIFGASMVILYTASTFYHALTHKRAKDIFELMDHGAIYLLIAGSFTPFALSVLGGSWGWSSLGSVWGLAILGIIYEVVFRRPWKWLSLSFYVGLGWLMTIVVKPMSAVLPSDGLSLIIAGGLSYTLGAVFYAWRAFPYHHAVWHVFVLGGTGCHFACVLLYVIPPA